MTNVQTFSIGKLSAGHFPLFDIVDGDADFGNALLQGVLISLFSNRRAEPEDEHDGEAQGWWSDSLSEDAPLGSRLWLLLRERSSPDVVERARLYAHEALAWVVSEGFAEGLDVDAEREGPVLSLSITVRRGDARAVYQFPDLWETLTHG